jgi:hypothetical protein
VIEDEITPHTRITRSPIERDLLVEIIAVASGLMLLFFASYAHAKPIGDLNNWLPKGAHFAAWEQPQLFSEEIRAAFRSSR